MDRHITGSTQAMGQETMPLLSAQQLEDYKQNGVLFPVALLTPDQADSTREAFCALEAMCGTRPTPNITSQCHLHFPWVFELISDPVLLDTVQQIIGEDILVHSTTLFHKHSRETQFVSWHQDAYYWGLSEPRLVSVWIALTLSTSENGCMQVIRASHRSGVLPHCLEARDKRNLLRSGLVVSDSPELGSAQDVILQPGQFSLHHPYTIHGSSPNRSGTARMGFAIRYVSAAVSQSGFHHEVLALRGNTRASRYKIVLPPDETNPQRALSNQMCFAERLAKQRRQQNRPDSKARIPLVGQSVTRYKDEQ